VTRGALLSLVYEAALTVRVAHARDVTLSDVQSAWGGLVFNLCRTWKRTDHLEN
jgi:hypothetical protein